MDVAYLQAKCTSSPFRSPTHHCPLLVLSRVSHSLLFNPKNINLRRWKNMCSASNSETLIAGSPKGQHKSHEVVTVKEEELGDLKSWMHKNGLPPCKVVLDERPSHNANHRPIHYVAASEDLQVRSEISDS